MCQAKQISSRNVLPCSIDRRLLPSGLPLVVTTTPSASRKDKEQKRVRFFIPENLPSRGERNASYPAVKGSRTHPTVQKAKGRWEPAIQRKITCDGKIEGRSVSLLPSIPVRRPSLEIHESDSSLIEHAERPNWIAPSGKAHPPMKKGADCYWIPAGFSIVTSEGAEVSLSLSMPVRRNSVDRFDDWIREEDQQNHCQTATYSDSSVDLPSGQAMSIQSASKAACLTIPIRRTSIEKASSKALCMPTRYCTFA